MQKICLDARMLGLFGIGTYLRHLLGYLHTGPFAVELIVHPDMVSKEPLLKHYSKIYCRAPIYSASEQLLLPHLIPKCDIFWSPHFNIPLLPIRARKRLVTIHDVFHLAFAKSFKWHKRAYATAILHQAARRADRIITVSNFSKTEIVKYTEADSDKITPIYFGVDHAFWAEKKKCNPVLPLRYFLFPGGFRPHKNLQRTLEAFALLSKQYDCHLIVLCKPEEAHLIEQKNVIFMPQVGIGFLAHLMQNATGLIFPSLYEGFGLPPIEAMAAGCPVIASYGSSLTEICDRAALYVDPYSVSELFDTMRQLMNDAERRQSLVHAGYLRCAEFNFNLFIKKHFAVLEELKRG